MMRLRTTAQTETVQAEAMTARGDAKRVGI